MEEAADLGGGEKGKKISFFKSKYEISCTVVKSMEMVSMSSNPGPDEVWKL